MIFRGEDELNQNEVLEIFKQAGALLEGHFRLSSGLHSDRYLQSALVLQYPGHATALGNALAAGLLELAPEPDLVMAPALGGILVAHEVARALGLRSLFAERESGTLTLRRGFRIKPGERCFVVEDVLTTGGSTRETMEVATRAGASILATGALIDRSGGKATTGVPSRALAVLEVPVFAADSCPLCQAGSTAVKPGSR
jgi:orotate phosphoribosyltransferase